MTEKQKRDSGQIYNPNYDKELGLEIVSCKDKCHKYNQLLLADSDGRKKLIDELNSYGFDFNYSDLGLDKLRTLYYGKEMYSENQNG